MGQLPPGNHPTTDPPRSCSRRPLASAISSREEPKPGYPHRRTPSRNFPSNVCKLIAKASEFLGGELNQTSNPEIVTVSPEAAPRTLSLQGFGRETCPQPNRPSLHQMCPVADVLDSMEEAAYTTEFLGGPGRDAEGRDYGQEKA